MKIFIKKVDGITSKRGLKQNKTYTVISRGNEKTIINNKISDHSNWYQCLDDKNKEYIIWNVKKDWTLIGISRTGRYSMSYTTSFEIIDLNLI